MTSATTAAAFHQWRDINGRTTLLKHKVYRLSLSQILSVERLLNFVYDVRGQSRSECSDHTIVWDTVIANHVTFGQRIDVGERRHFYHCRHRNRLIRRQQYCRNQPPGGRSAQYLSDKKNK
jgi:hypothetical protein